MSLMYCLSASALKPLVTYSADMACTSTLGSSSGRLYVMVVLSALMFIVLMSMRTSLRFSTEVW